MTGLFSCALAAQENVAADSRSEAIRLSRTGGMVREANTGPSILVLDLQGRVLPQGVLQQLTREMEDGLRLPLTFATKKPAPLEKTLDGVFVDKSVAFVVAVVSEPGKPSLLVAPESRWVAVNVAQLKAGTADGDTLILRVRKELWRALGYLMGAGNSITEHCLLKPVFDLDGLDAIKMQVLSPEPMNQMHQSASALGVRSIRVATYRTACLQGWAPTPTNDYQRAIWDEIKAKAEAK